MKRVVLTIAMIAIITVLIIILIRNCGSNSNKYSLQKLHQTLSLRYGSWQDELPEQKMSIQFIRPNDTVLELGGNIGRNSLVIASILSTPSRLVTLETDPKIALQLDENRQANRLPFQIVCAALSARPLIQSGWVTEPMPESGVIPDGYIPVKTVSYNDLRKMVPTPFTALVADCEGALFYILRDFPQLLRDVRTVVMENDYTDITHKQEVDQRLRSNGFKCVFRQAGGWGPCYDCFFEVWQK